SYFEKAIDSKENEQNALITLSQLYTRVNKPKSAEEAFQRFYNLSDDPYAEIYALWFTDAVIGYRGSRKSDGQLKFLEKLSKDPRRIGKIDAAMNYWLGTHHAFSFDKPNSRKYYKKINNIKNWDCLGPFDNVMNSGFDKDFGVLANPNPDAIFKSKYGASIKWFDPEMSPSDGYIFQRTNFTGYNSIVYYQTFVQSKEIKDVILKIGYTGSLKVWVNDVLMHSISEKRKTEMDYFQYKGKLQKGYNRILVQLGNYNASYANFTLRFTDLKHHNLDFSNTNEVQKYPKGQFHAEKIPFYAVEQLKKKIADNPNDLIYPFLLAKTYTRSNEINEAENILLKLQKKYPTNYLVLRSLINLYEQSGNSTEQNRYYEIYEKNNPDDMDILTNEISKHNNKKDKAEYVKLTNKFKLLYGDNYTKLTYDSNLDALNENYDAVIKKLEELYAKYPNKFDPVVSAYNLEKEFYNNPTKANKILEKYLENNFNYKILSQLITNYTEEGNHAKAIELIQKTTDLFEYDLQMNKELINIYYRQKQYDKAIKLAEKIIFINPSNYEMLKDLGVLYNMKGKTKKAIEYYERSLSYFPFSFEVNEKLRELKGQTTVMNLVEKIDPDEAIDNYKKNFKTDKKEIFDIVVNNRSFIVFKSKAVGSLVEYIIKINDEKAIQQYQAIEFSPGGNFNGYINEAQTIKANGNKINGERNSGTVTFTQLEVGDYIYVSYMETQVYGGKSSLFVYDDFSFNSYSPTYEVNYNIFTEEGMKPNFKAVNHSYQSKKKTLEGFNINSWQVINPEPLKSDFYSVPYADIAQSLHFSIGSSWYDIAQWYSDLSGHQARPNYTIETITKELFNGKNYSK
ncbi:MAG TPA: tetratricopeptide repeat protein, partial [Bacteroidetes bacterium]|nr:tetratricopeptide repeat protein [Bacteroidota bacterium]